MKRKAKILFFYISPVTGLNVFLGRRITSEKEEFWWLPGGSMEPNESEFESAVRELYEELIPSPHFIHVINNYISNKVEPPKIEYVSPNSENIIFLVHLDEQKTHNETLPLIKDEFEEIRWFPIKNLPSNMSREFKFAKEYFDQKAIEDLFGSFDYSLYY